MKKMVMKVSVKTPTKQTGAVLYISLIMLLLLSIIGITGMQVTGLEEKMSGNTRDSNLAFQSAEATLRAGEQALTAAAPPVFNNTAGHYIFKPGATERWETVDWTSQSESIPYGGAQASVSSTTQPKYIIEELQSLASTMEAGNQLDITYYQVTARAVGGTDTTVTVLQSIYKLQ